MNKSACLSIEQANIFQFRYMDLAMTRDDGIKKTPFTLKKLEAIGRIAPRGLDIDVSTEMSLEVGLQNHAGRN